MMNESQDISNTSDDFFLQSNNLNLLLPILEHTQLLLRIQQVKHLQVHDDVTCQLTTQTYSIFTMLLVG